MRSHQTSRTWQISHFGIKYEFGISFKREKKMDAEDKILMMGYLLMKKRRNHQQQKQWSEKYFCWITRCHSSFVVTCCTTFCHLLTLVITQCTTRLSFYKRSFLYCFIELQSLPNFVCSCIFDGLTSKVADVLAVFLWSQ